MGSDITLSLAGPQDARGIREVFDDGGFGGGGFGGGISVKFCREPDPYRSFQNDGDLVVMPVAKDAGTGGVVGVGCCVVRRGHVNGALRNTGYLAGLKILRSHQRRVRQIIPAYRLIAERTAPLEPFYYTTILESNEAAMKLLEKRRRGMPRYVRLGGYTVFCYGTGGKAGGGGAGGYMFERGHSEAVAEFYARNLPGYNLSPKDEWLHGLGAGDFFSLRRSPGGEVLAACALWDQQAYKQYVVTGYGGIYKALSRMPTRLLGYPQMPRAGTPANYVSIAALVVPEANLDVAGLFLRLALREAGRYGFAMLGLFENHPLAEAARTIRHVKYRSWVYAVEYEGGVVATPHADVDGKAAPHTEDGVVATPPKDVDGMAPPHMEDGVMAPPHTAVDGMAPLHKAVIHGSGAGGLDGRPVMLEVGLL